MKRSGLAVTLLVLTASLPAHAGEARQDCCACIIPDHDTAVPALFCISGNERETTLASQRCTKDLGGVFECVARSDESAAVTPECFEELREANIICPELAPVPALGIPALVVIAGVLSLLGALTLRRRGRSSASRG